MNGMAYVSPVIDTKIMGLSQLVKGQSRPKKKKKSSKPSFNRSNPRSNFQRPMFNNNNNYQQINCNNQNRDRYVSSINVFSLNQIFSIIIMRVHQIDFKRWLQERIRGDLNLRSILIY